MIFSIIVSNTCKRNFVSNFHRDYIAVKAMSKDAHVLECNFKYHQNDCWQLFQCGKIGPHPNLKSTIIGIYFLFVVYIARFNEKLQHFYVGVAFKVAWTRRDSLDFTSQKKWHADK